MSIHADDQSALSPADAVAAIVLLGDDRIVLQMRDDKPGIFFPGHWGLFGGALEESESEECALTRELSEEIGVSVRGARRLMKFDFDLSGMGLGSFNRSFFEVRLSDAEFDSIRLGEGREVRAFTRKEALELHPVTPYDAFALWCYANQTRISKQ